MFKFSLSVRAYHEGRRYGLPCVDDWFRTPDEVMSLACRLAAEQILAHHRGKKTAIELFRASGMGVYNIALLMVDEGVTVERIAELCNSFDSRLHDTWT